jgi:hypothetical protein
MERIKSSDVLDATHEASQTFRGVVVGHFRRMGPNPWDDYQFVRTDSKASAAPSAETSAAQPPAEVRVLPRVPLQLEKRGCEFRMRSEGRVVRARWCPEPADLETLGTEAAPAQVRRYFLEHCLRALGAEGAVGATAVMVKKLNQPG